MDIERARETVRELFRITVDALSPERLVREALSLEGATPRVAGQPLDVRRGGRIVVVAIGKAAVSMALGAATVLAERIDRCVVVTKRGATIPPGLRQRFEIHEASHPVPDESSVEAGLAVLAAVEPLGEDDLVVMLISGGGSALVEAPVDGVSLDDIASATEVLLRAGADIRALNAVRRRLSRIKAGGLARAAAPARVVNLIISDVLGSPLPVIASGPSVDPGPWDPRDLALARQPDVWPRLPEPVRARLERPDADGGSLTNVALSAVLADVDTAAAEAARAARRLGYSPVTLGTRFEGEARSFAGFWSELARYAAEGEAASSQPRCLVGAGELTVTVRGDGEGGRNTEMALAAAPRIAGMERIAIASLATDGDDGTTGAAGGVVVGDSVALAERAGLNPAKLLENNDSARFLRAVGGLIETGQTGTNVNDLYLALIE